MHVYSTAAVWFPQTIRVHFFFSYFYFLSFLFHLLTVKTLLNNGTVILVCRGMVWTRASVKIHTCPRPRSFFFFWLFFRKYSNEFIHSASTLLVHHFIRASKQRRKGDEKIFFFLNSFHLVLDWIESEKNAMTSKCLQD